MCITEGAIESNCDFFLSVWSHQPLLLEWSLDNNSVQTRNLPTVPPAGIAGHQDVNAMLNIDKLENNFEDFEGYKILY